jgi:hypothetical protein
MKKSEIEKNIKESIEMLKYIAESMVSNKRVKFVDIHSVIPDYLNQEELGLHSVYFEIKYSKDIEIYDTSDVPSVMDDIFESYYSFIGTVNFDSNGDLTDKQSEDSSLGMVTNIQYSIHNQKGFEITIASDITIED